MRLIARLDIKNEYVIKGIQLEGLRKIGDPNEIALSYYNEGIDEIVFMDAVASLYDRNNLFNVIEKACTNIFVPIAVGGGIRSLDDVSKVLNCGADKVIINTAAVRDIKIVENVANRYGSQCLVGSIEAKFINDKWIAYTDNGRESSGIDVMEWVDRLEKSGVGEILLTSVDTEGTMRGFDVKLIEEVHGATNRPVICSGGYGKPIHLSKLLSLVQPSAIAIASVLHYKKDNVSDLKKRLHGMPK